ncbi:MAG: outer membrane protein transport protein [Mariniphaga sp.]|nr:outer membrane protein transport protein [Mariniphaga sp.]
MKQFITCLSLALFVSFSIQAQDYTDALRYSNFQLQGTARSGAMGNAFGALGGDFTSVSINPAGLGLYRSSELVFTPTFGQNQVETSYRGNLMSDKKYNFSFNNISYVTSLPVKNQSESGIVSVNVGIGFNRLKDFNSTMLAGAKNLNSSYLDYFADNATVGNWSDYYEELAWNTYLIWPYENDPDVYYHDVEQAGYGQSQRKSISLQGYINEYSLAGGLNFNHKLYLGASIGIVDVSYKESSELLEWDEQNNINFFDEMQFNSYLRTTGTGYNGKIGVIYKPINELRLGASLHTPTFYNLHDFFKTSMSSTAADEDGVMGSYLENSPYSDYDYDLETPLRVALSAAYVFANKGLVSVDYELADYGSASLRRGGDGYNFVDENSEIAQLYKNAGTLRIGGEFLATSKISLRAGYENYASPYNNQAFDANQPNANAKLNIYSAGLGYKSGGFFFDIAYRLSNNKSYDMLYPELPTDFYTQPEMAEFDAVQNNIMFTLGFKF